MCLSDAYELKNGEQNLICSRVSSVAAEGDKITLTDLMGIRTVVTGSLRSVDLTRNIILIDAKEAS